MFLPEESPIQAPLFSSAHVATFHPRGSVPLTGQDYRTDEPNSVDMRTNCDGLGFNNQPNELKRNGSHHFHQRSSVRSIDGEEVTYPEQFSLYNSFTSGSDAESSHITQGEKNRISDGYTIGTMLQNPIFKGANHNVMSKLLPSEMSPDDPGDEPPDYFAATTITSSDPDTNTDNMKLKLL